MSATVIKSVGSSFTVIDPSGHQHQCKIKGTFRIKDIDSTNPIAVGDKVTVTFDTGTEFGLITAIEPRQNYIIRKSTNLSKQTQILAANVDMAVLIVTPRLPKTSTGFIDRFIATAEAYHIKTILVFNKMDLFKGNDYALVDDYKKIYELLGYGCYEVSAKNNNGIPEVRKVMQGKTSLVAGHSGVGKSAFINAIEPTLTLRTGAISDQHQTGKHTTTFAEMFPLKAGGFIIDSPGIRELGTVDFLPQEVSHYFVEMRALLPQCKFNNCLHINENKCAVKDALIAGKISPDRYHNYLSIMEGKDLFK
ncbi:MAG: ribosome small subunit-dependent GTPase A [Bacteroidia bacterium]|nr:ribosome small subunit-dependent GTPase A [Bacteroidia bacterium]